MDIERNSFSSRQSNQYKNTDRASIKSIMSL
jgi:hypothetical protein